MSQHRPHLPSQIHYSREAALESQLSLQILSSGLSRCIQTPSLQALAACGQLQEPSCKACHFEKFSSCIQTADKLVGPMEISR